ncbi:uncharacterized protein LOC109841646 [Asparagus officinalis]|uniref:uncharacterized protein LOC109841646 n=1 Tax=Asparagus officinalis TaxID=4686 RepID=UPI00098E4125|nr:uncharacterized protein LOC109841646 [Asparagus officinalis]
MPYMQQETTQASEGQHTTTSNQKEHYATFENKFNGQAGQSLRPNHGEEKKEAKEEKEKDEEDEEKDEVSDETFDDIDKHMLSFRMASIERSVHCLENNIKKIMLEITQAIFEMRDDVSTLKSDIRESKLYSKVKILVIIEEKLCNICISLKGESFEKERRNPLSHGSNIGENSVHVDLNMEPLNMDSEWMNGETYMSPHHEQRESSKKHQTTLENMKPLRSVQKKMSFAQKKSKEVEDTINMCQRNKHSHEEKIISAFQGAEKEDPDLLPLGLTQDEVIAITYYKACIRKGEKIKSFVQIGDIILTGEYLKPLLASGNFGIDAWLSNEIIDAYTYLLRLRSSNQNFDNNKISYQSCFAYGLLQRNVQQGVTSSFHNIKKYANDVREIMSSDMVYLLLCLYSLQSFSNNSVDNSMTKSFFIIHVFIGVSEGNHWRLKPGGGGVNAAKFKAALKRPIVVRYIQSSQQFRRH